MTQTIDYVPVVTVNSRFDPEVISSAASMIGEELSNGSREAVYAASGGQYPIPLDEVPGLSGLSEDQMDTMARDLRAGDYRDADVVVALAPYIMERNGNGTPTYYMTEVGVLFITTETMELDPRRPQEFLENFPRLAAGEIRRYAEALR